MTAYFPCGNWKELGTDGGWTKLGCPFCGEVMEVGESEGKDDVRFCSRCGTALAWENGTGK